MLEREFVISFVQRTGYYIVNGITLYRLIAAPVLLILLFTGHFIWFKWLIAVSFFTDAIDGFLARGLKVTSRLGSKLDSIGDDLTVAVGVVGMLVMYPGFIREQKFWLLGLFALFIIQFVLALRKYGKMSNFHTYLAKLSAILQGVFLILLFFTDRPDTFLFYTTIVITALQIIEEIIIVLISPDFRTDVRGLYWVLKKQREERRNSMTT